MAPKFISILFTIPILLLSTFFGNADKRFYVWTYEYKTEEKGKAELEYYLTFSSTDFSNLKETLSTEHQVEFEVGMTDKFDIALYQVFEQPVDDQFSYKGFKLRARYKISEKNKLFLDPLIYIEYKANPTFTKNELEFKLILAKDIGKFNISINPIFEFENEEEWEFKPEYALGLSYEINPLLRIGLESKGGSNGYYIGSVISHGKTHAWVALGSAFKITNIKENKPEFQIRLLMGLEF